MRKIQIPILLLFITTLSCSHINYYLNYDYLFRKRINVEQAIVEKVKMDNSSNPAYRYMLSEELRDKLIEIKNIPVKDVIPSNNIDYKFCVIVEVMTSKGMIECYLYTRNIYEQEDIKTVSVLEKGKTLIDAVGRFNRFFSLLDESYAKIEVTQAIIKIRSK